MRRYTFIESTLTISAPIRSATARPTAPLPEPVQPIRKSTRTPIVYPLIPRFAIAAAQRPTRPTGTQA